MPFEWGIPILFIVPSIAMLDLKHLYSYISFDAAQFIIPVSKRKMGVFGASGSRRTKTSRKGNKGDINLRLLGV